MVFEKMMRFHAGVGVVVVDSDAGNSEVWCWFLGLGEQSCFW